MVLLCIFNDFIICNDFRLIKLETIYHQKEIIASAPTSHTFTRNNRRNCVLGAPNQLKLSAPTSVTDIGMIADRIKQTMGSLKPVSIENPLSVNFRTEGA